MLLFKQFLNQFGDQVEFLGLKYVQEKSTTLSVRNSKSEGSSFDFDHGVRLEVLVNGHWGYAGTTDLTESGLIRAFEKAVGVTKKLSAIKAFPFNSQSRQKSLGSYRTQLQRSLDSLSLAEIQSVLLQCADSMNTDPRIFHRAASAIVVETQEWRLDSWGSEIEQHFAIVNLDLVSRAQGKEDIQTRSHNICLQIGSEVFLKNFLIPIAEQLAKDVIELIQAPNCSKETLDLLISPDQMALQIHETVGHPLEVDRILGDERNYAGWSFVERSDFGNLKYGSSKMNICFQPDRFSELASYNFDDSGLRAEKEYLIQEGTLVRGLGSLESQHRSDLKAVANSRSSSWNRPPIDRMANLNLDAGTIGLYDLISKIENGLWVSTNRSWSIDDYRRKFQFGCEYGVVIKEGQIKNVVKNPNYHGVSVPFWNQLKEVSSDVGVFGSFYCGKGEPNQIIRVGHTSPYSLFSNVEVF